MKNVFKSAKMLSSSERGFFNFSGKAILRSELMNRIKGGTADGGSGVINIPPPPK